VDPVTLRIRAARPVLPVVMVTFRELRCGAGGGDASPGGDAVRPELVEYLRPGRFVDSDAPAVRAFAREAVASATDPVEQAALLFAAVRDRIWYDPFVVSDDPERYLAQILGAFRDTYRDRMITSTADTGTDAFTAPSVAS
jgi:transglutaminase-like putative cysteine protease